MTNPTRPDDATRAAERAQADRAHEPDREPTPEEAEKAEGLQADPEVIAREKEMAERGKHQEGEGRIP